MLLAWSLLGVQLGPPELPERPTVDDRAVVRDEDKEAQGGADPPNEILVGPGYRVSWHPVAGCPPGNAMDEALRRSLAGAGPVGALGFVEARVAVRRRGDTFEMSFERVGMHGAGRREVVARTCEELANVAALIVAIGVDPLLLERRAVPVLRPEQPHPAGVAPREEGPPPTPVGGRIAKTEPVSRRVAVQPAAPAGVSRSMPWRSLGLRIAGGPGVGVLPRVAAQFGVALVGSGRYFLGELEGSMWVPQTVPLAGVDAGAARHLVGMVTGRACGVLRRGRISAPLCVGFDVGGLEVRGRGAGLAEPATARALWLGARAGGRLSFALHPRWALQVGAEVLVPLHRARFHTVTPDGTRREIRQVPAVGAVFTVGVEFRLGGRGGAEADLARGPRISKAAH